MASAVITLGAAQLPVNPLPLGKLRKLIPMFQQVGRAFALGSVSEEDITGVIQIISLATGMPEAELEAMPGTYLQMMQAVEVVAEVSGLRPAGEGATPGEAPRPGTASPA